VPARKYANVNDACMRQSRGPQQESSVLTQDSQNVFEFMPSSHEIDTSVLAHADTKLLACWCQARVRPSTGAPASHQSKQHPAALIICSDTARFTTAYDQSCWALFGLIAMLCKSENCKCASQKNGCASPCFMDLSPTKLCVLRYLEILSLA
jgi:hypothetical protein